MATFHSPYPKDEQFTLNTALLIYTNNHEALIMRAGVDTSNGEPCLKNPETVTDDFLKGLLELNNQRPLTLLPENALAMTHNAYAWFVPAQERILRFNAYSDAAINTLSGQVFPQPPLVFITRGSQLSLYALKENVRPKADTPLCYAPYWNTGTTVCMGSSTRPATGDISDAPYWEQAFYESNFTHPQGHGGKSCWTSQFTHLELWQEAQKQGHFDPEWLVPTGKTLEQTILKGGN